MRYRLLGRTGPYVSERCIGETHPSNILGLRAAAAPESIDGPRVAPRDPCKAAGGTCPSQVHCKPRSRPYCNLLTSTARSTPSTFNLAPSADT